MAIAQVRRQLIEDTHKRVLRVTRDLIAEGGWAAAQISVIASRSALATGSIYRYFDSKVDLCVQVLAQDLLEVVLVQLVVERIPGRETAEVGPRQLVVGHALEVVDVAGTGQAHLFEPVRHADVLEHFHGAGVQGERPRGV